MCGIMGIVGDLPPRVAAMHVRAMGQWLVHRGPDDWGEYTASGIAFGHTRLSILDIQGGRQPMSTPDGTEVVVFNGEIYNAREIRLRLESLGHRFQTDHSDTEVLLYAYRQWGSGMLRLLEGMYAFALWDSRERALLIARDRLGIKPLYYAITSAGAVFASEPKAILASGLVPKDFDDRQLACYFTFRATINPHTFWRGICKLAPGHFAFLGADRSTAPKRYWAPRQNLDSPSSLAEAADRLTYGLESSIKKQLVADVPLGLFLSGGVDSALIASVAAKHGELHAFTVGTRSKLDETKYAAEVSQRFGLKFHSLYVSPIDFLQGMQTWCYYNDDPVSDPSALALMMVARFARGHGMKAMLCGEGGDELFGGYNSYRRYLLVNRVTRIPAAAYILNRLPINGQSRTMEYLRAGDPSIFLGTAHLSTRDIRNSLLIDGGDPPTSEPAMGLRPALVFDQLTRLGDDILARTDRATMAVSLEARVPFLDTDVIDLANSLLDSYCIHPVSYSCKRVLKRILGRHLRRGLIRRGKRGFDLPIQDWLIRDFRDTMQQYLSERTIPGINYTYLREQYCRISERRIYDRAGLAVTLLWAWIVIEHWYRLWVRGEAEPRGAADVAGASPAIRALARAAELQA